MGTITLPNFRTTADVTMNTRLKDGGVYIDWAGLTNIKAWLYSDAQKAIAGRCDVEIDEADSTKLVCRYSASKPQYLGLNKIIVQATYMGGTKTYDKTVFNFVRWTADQSGTQITIDDPEVDVEIVAEDISSSIINEAVRAALAAAAHAEHAAHLIPNQVLLDCEAATAVALTAATHAPTIGENGNWWVWNATQEAYEDTGNEAQGPTGNGIASWSVVESQEDAGSNVVTVTFTDGTSETFTYKNGHTGNGIASIVQTVESPDDAGTNVITITMTNGTVVTFNIKNGSKGQPGAAQAAYKSVETLPTASAATMDKIYLTPSGTSGVYNMSYTDYDGSAYSWVSLGTTAIQLSDYATKAEASQLEAKVTAISLDATVHSVAAGLIKTDGSPTSSNAYTRTDIINDGYAKIYARVGGASGSYNAVSFFSDTTPSSTSFISGVGVASGIKEHNLTVPANCKLIVVCNRTANLNSPTIIFNDADLSAIRKDIISLQNKDAELTETLTEQRELIDDSYKSVYNIYDAIEDGLITQSEQAFVRWSSGAVVSTQLNMRVHLIPNDSYTIIDCECSSRDNIPAQIAFYNSSNADDSTYISGVKNVPGITHYKADVPDGCKLIAITNDYDIVASPTITVYQSRVGLLEKPGTQGYFPNPFAGMPYYAHIAAADMLKNGAGQRLVGSQTLDDVEMMARLGFKWIEANIKKTSDGVFICLHGTSTGTFGNVNFVSLAGDDLADMAISETAYSYVRDNIRYRSILPKYQVPPPTLTKFCECCKVHNIGLFAGTSDPDAIAVVRRIMGDDNLILYNPPQGIRESFKGMIFEWKNSASVSAADVIESAAKYGRPYLCGIGPTLYDALEQTDGLAQFIKTLHDNGYYVGAAYLTEEQVLTAFRAGMDFYGSNHMTNSFVGGDVYDLNEGNITTDGDITNGVLSLSDGESVSCGGDGNYSLGVASLYIRFSGTLAITFGAWGERTMTSTGEDIVISDFLLQNSPHLEIVSDGETMITELVYKTMKV